MAAYADPDMEAIGRSIDRAMTNHTRKVSQLDALQDELGLYFDEEAATEIAKQTMKRLNPNPTASHQITIDQIVGRARKEHKRKVSQFQAIKGDISQYFPNEEDSTKLAAQIMKDINPNERSGQAEELTIESIVERAVTNHKRKISKVRAVQNDLGLMFDQDDVNTITKDVMKQVFAHKHSELQYMDDEALQKRAQRANKSRKESIVTPNIFDTSADDYMDAEAMQKRQERLNKTRKESIMTPDIFSDNYHPDPNSKEYIESMQQKMEDLKYELQKKDEEIAEMREFIDELTQSKATLALNSNRSLNQMRGYLLEYQRSLFDI